MMQSTKDQESLVKRQKVSKKQNSASTREEVSKQALRLQNFKKKISNHGIFENKSLAISNKNMEKSDDSVKEINLKNKLNQSDTTKEYKPNDPNLTFGSLRGMIPGSSLYPNSLNLKTKFEDLKLSVNEKQFDKKEEKVIINESNYFSNYF